MKKVSFSACPHIRPDNDEFAVTRIIELFGTTEFPGVSSNPLVLVDAGLQLSAKQVADWRAGGSIPVGTGGQFADFDEHGKGDGTSAATMAAEHFGVAKDTGLVPILAYALQADDKAQDGPFNLARIIKDMHSFGVPTEVIRKMHRRWFDSQYLFFRGRRLPRRSFMPLQRMAVDWLLEGFGQELTGEQTLSFEGAMEALGERLTPEQADEIREIQRFVDNPRGFDSTPFDLEGLVECMKEIGVPESEIIADVRMVLDAKVFVQSEFMAAQKYFRERVRYVDGSSLKVAVISSDNEQMNRAARSVDKDLAVLVQKRSSGHVNVFGGENNRRDLRPILGRLRVAEERKAGRNFRLSSEQMASGGTLPQILAWFGFEKYEKIIGIFNGSLKTRSVPRTKLSLDEIVACVREGLKHTHVARGVVRDQRHKAAEDVVVHEAELATA